MESEEMERHVSCKRKPKKAGVAILTSDKIDFKTKIITKDKDEHYKNDKRSIQQDEHSICKYSCTQHKIT